MRGNVLEVLRRTHGKPSAEELLLWDWNRLVRELSTLHDHQIQESCTCAVCREMCTRKHLLLIEQYAEETVPAEDSKAYRERLAELATEAREHRTREERAMLGYAVSEDLVGWADAWCDEFSGHVGEYLSASTSAREKSNALSKLLSRRSDDSETSADRAAETPDEQVLDRATAG